MLKCSPTLGRARPGWQWWQDNRTLALGPSEWDLATGSTSQKTTKPEEGQGHGWWGGEVGPPTQARPASLLWVPSSGRDSCQGPI